MRTTDLFKNNRSAKKLNESLQKTFGKHIDLKSMDLPRLEDARNKLRTQLHDARSQSGFNENLENEAMTQAQWMLDAINAEIAEREEFIADPHQAEMSMEEDDQEDVVDLDLNIDGGVYWATNSPEGVLIHVEDVRVNEDQKFWIDFTYNLATGEISGYKMTDDYNGAYEPADDDVDATIDYVISSVKDQYGETWEEIKNNAEGGMEVEPEESMQESDGSESELMRQIASGEVDAYQIMNSPRGTEEEAASKIMNDMYGEIINSDEIGSLHPDDDFEQILDMVVDKIADEYGTNDDGYDDEGGETDDNYALASAGFGSDEDYGYYGQDESMAMEKAPPGDKYERMVKHIKKGYAKDGKLTPKEKSIAYATAWKAKNKNESIESGEDMTKLNEGEIQQASAIVNAKTMVDRVGRWIEELSGMENDTLLQLGDSIRDEMSAELAKTFISQVAPAIQQALETLKGTRETLASGVRMLTGEEQGAEMIGAEPGAELGGEIGGAEPDMMNAGGDELGGFEEPADEFGASDAAAGGLGDTGRAQRESIDRGNNLLRILAG